MMLIQTPGGFLWAASLAARVGWAGWSAWGTYVVAGLLQGCLLAMALWFEFSARMRRRDGDGNGSETGIPRGRKVRNNNSTDYDHQDYGDEDGISHVIAAAGQGRGSSNERQQALIDDDDQAVEGVDQGRRRTDEQTPLLSSSSPGAVNNNVR